MSSINSLASAIGTAASGSSSTSSTTPNPNASLTANDFIQFMVTELQNQDPLDPTDSDEMLSQMTDIGQLESSTDLQNSLTTMVTQNQIASAANMIGMNIQGTDANSNQVSGTVSSVQVSTSGVNLIMSTGDTVPLNNVTSITSGSGSSSGSS
jgi:flagellar basal-body rod modification protein FlgD